jgi:tetratricopeptide (TPR) repeat protein
MRSRPVTKNSPGVSTRVWLLIFVALLAVTALAYRPAWHGGFVWDDDGHVTAEGLRGTDGLKRIWREPGATQQYYPALHTAFWLQYQLFGLSTTGYHLVGISFHAIVAFLVAVVLRRLAIPGALAAAFVFALHPVHVESVAWITEQKNTLSAIFFLLSALLYFDFDERRTSGRYVFALGMFLLALCSKTVTATLPAVLLVVFWWRRRRLDLRRDVRPLLPFFALSLGAAAMTIWVERTFIGARGSEFELGWIERILLASRAVWFYLSKIVWPSNLSFNYPRWTIDPASPAAWLYAIALAALLVLLWRWRERTAHMLAALLAFCILLSPALGFVAVYPFRYSFVADHFQYLASIPVIALLCASATAVVRRRAASRLGATLPAAGVCILLALLTWMQAATYADAETLYRATLERNPASWLAANNLGMIASRRSAEESVPFFERALQHKPDLFEARLNLGFAYQQVGRLDDAVREYRRVIASHPSSAEAYNNVCSALQQKGDMTGALSACGEALRLAPNYAKAHFNMGLALRRVGDERAIAHLAEAVRLDPRQADVRTALAAAYNDRGLQLQRRGRVPEAIADHQEALRLRPDFAEAANNLGAALQRQDRLDEAAVAFGHAIKAAPQFADARFNFANLLMSQGRAAEAIPHYEAALSTNPRDVSARVNLGVALQRVGRIEAAIEQFREALRIDPSSIAAQQNLKALRK